jgi:3-deoxy-D-manno-octulosonic-acid transferase
MYRKSKNSGLMIYIYKLIGFIIIPIIKINIKLRISNNKEVLSRYRERYGLSKYKFNDKKKVIWIHAASVGEFKSSDYFIKKFNKDFNLLVTTTTVSAAEYAIKNYGNNIIHQYAPLDIDIWINRFLNNWKPNFIIWIESDLWPATLFSIKKKGIPAILVNLRLSPQSLKKWKLLPSFYDSLLECFNDVFVQSEEDKQRIQTITGKKLNFIGNLKLISTSLNSQNKNIIKLKKENNIKYLMLASTHQNEEIILKPLIEELLNTYKNLHLIIAPRHPERAGEILKLFSSDNLKTQILSKKNHNYHKVLIIDSLGVLSTYFNLSDIVFLGGSFTPSGGHNPIEPALQNCAIITGPSIFNWQNIFNNMIKNNACIKVECVEELKNIIIKLLNNNNELNKIKVNSLEFSKQEFTDTKSLDKIINNYLAIC